MNSVKTILIALVTHPVWRRVRPGVQADEWNKKTVMTFSQPVEIPGQILPAGTYTIKLVNLDPDRHVVQFLDADGINGQSPPSWPSTTGGFIPPVKPSSPLRKEAEIIRKR